MKKLLASILVICMIAAIAPTFAVSAAEAPTSVSIFGTGSEWSYMLSTRSAFATTYDPDSNSTITEKDWWKDANYDDTAWFTGSDFLNPGAIGWEEGNADDDKVHDLSLRKTFTVTDMADFAGKELFGRLRIDDNVNIYINGEKVYYYGSWNDGYEVVSFGYAEDLLVTGENLIAVTVEDGFGGRSFDLSLFAYGKDSTPEFAGKKLVSLNSAWEYYVSATADYAREANADWTLSTFEGTWTKDKTAPYGNRSDVFNRSDIGWTVDGKNYLYVRQEFEVSAAELASYEGNVLSMATYYDDDVAFYVNGTQVFTHANWNDYYQRKVLAENATSLLHEGTNVFAVALLQHSGGYEFDASLSVEPSREDMSLLLEGKNYIESRVALNTNDCGFLDGNLFTDFDCLGGVAYPGQVLVFVNGQLAKMNTNHSGKVNNRQLFFALEGVEFVAGDELEFTFLFADEGWYTKTTVQAPFTSAGYTKSTTTLRGQRLISTVEYDAGTVIPYSVNDTVPARIHDEHGSSFNLTVKEITGTKVTYTADDVLSTHTLLEIGYGTAFRTAVNIDEKAGGGLLADTESFAGYAQTKTVSSTTSDFRFIITADYDAVAPIYNETSKVTIVFKNADATVKTLITNFQEFTYYYQVIANGEYYYAANGDILFGTIVTNIPNDAWTTATITINNGTADVYTGTASNTTAVGIQNAFTAVIGEINTDSNGYNKNNGNEGLAQLFDDQTTTKYGTVHPGDTMNVTWQYAAPVTPKAYIIYTGTDSAQWKGRNPSGWTLYGSTDGTNYVVLDKVAPSPLEDLNSTPYGFAFNNDTSYQYFKIEFTGGYIQLSELTLYN